MFMRGRTKSFPRRMLNEDFGEYLRRKRGRLAVGVAGYLALGVVATIGEFYLLGERSYFWYALGFFHAVWLALLVGMIAMMWMAYSPKAIRYLRGTLGEDNTEDVLKAARRTSIWGSVSSIEAGGTDVDHLVVTRSGGVLAIDSKWRNEVTSEALACMAESARKTARRAESIMRSEHVGTLKRDTHARHRTQTLSYRVQPVVVVWGAALQQLSGTYTDAGVEFVTGPGLAQWLRSLRGQDVDESAAKDLLIRLAEFKNR